MIATMMKTPALAVLALLFLAEGWLTYTPPRGAQWLKKSWTNAEVVALGAATTGEVTVGVLPERALALAAFVWVDTACTGTTTLTASVGPDASETAYVLPGDVKAVANTVYGDAVGEVGASMSGGLGHLPSITATTTVKILFTSTVQNLNAATTCTGTAWVSYEVLP